MEFQVEAFIAPVASPAELYPIHEIAALVNPDCTELHPQFPDEIPEETYPNTKLAPAISKSSMPNHSPSGSVYFKGLFRP